MVSVSDFQSESIYRRRGFNGLPGWGYRPLLAGPVAQRESPRTLSACVCV